MDLPKDCGSKPPSSTSMIESGLNNSHEKGSLEADDATAVSNVQATDSDGEPEKDLVIQSSGALVEPELKRDSKELSVEPAESISIRETIEVPILKDLDDEVLASPRTSARRSHKDRQVFASPRPSRKNYPCPREVSPGRLVAAPVHRPPSGNIESPYFGHRPAPKLPALALPPQRVNYCRRYWIPVLVVAIAIVIIVPLVCLGFYMDYFRCTEFETYRCIMFGAQACIRGALGLECVCVVNKTVRPCGEPNCRRVARNICPNRICVEPVQCMYTRPYIERLAMEKRSTEITCAEVISEVCASDGRIPFCPRARTYKIGHMCNPDPLKPTNCTPMPQNVVTDEFRDDFCYRLRHIYACLVGLLETSTNGTVVNCARRCPHWEGDSCPCTLNGKQQMGKTSGKMDGVTISQHCAPIKPKRQCRGRPKFVDHLSETWFDIENDLVKKHFHSDLESPASFMQKVNAVEPAYVDDYMRIYMQARDDLKYRKATCLAIALTLGGFYMASQDDGQAFLKEIYNMSTWNGPRISTRLRTSGTVEYWLFTDHKTVFTIDDPCSWDSRSHRRIGVLPDFYASAQLVHFLFNPNGSNPVQMDGVSWAALSLAEQAKFRYMMCIGPGLNTMECERILFWRFRSSWALNRREIDFLEDIYNTSMLDTQTDLLTLEDEFYWAVRLLRIFSTNNSTVTFLPTADPISTQNDDTGSSAAEQRSLNHKSKFSVAENSEWPSQSTLVNYLVNVTPDILQDSDTTFARLGHLAAPLRLDSGDAAVQRQTLDTLGESSKFKTLSSHTSDTVESKTTQAPVTRAPNRNVRLDLRKYICDCVLGVKC